MAQTHFCMRIAVHDMSGHPFQLQLSRQLAGNGHSILHLFFSGISGPKGNSTVSSSEEERLRIDAVNIKFPFRKYSYINRLFAHRYYAAEVFERIAAFRPDVVLSGNTPTDAEYYLQTRCLREGFRFVHWVQDFYPLALERLLNRKIPGLGSIASFFHALERRIFRASHAVIYISPDFASYARSVRYCPSRSYVIENWAALNELPVRKKENAWSVKHGLARKFVFLYSGTMGLKHDPESLVALARAFRNEPEVLVVLVSEGIGRDYIDERKKQESLENLRIFDYQPAESLPDVFGSADVLLANVEAESSDFCVPSKVLSYLCSGRPILLSVPRRNLIARVIETSGAGYVTEPADTESLLRHARELMENNELRQSLGRNARHYAETTFDIQAIARRFEEALS